VFENLIESKRKANVKRGLSTGFFSMVMHTGIVAGAVYATISSGANEEAGTLDTLMVYVTQQQEEQKPEEPQPVVLDVPLKGFQTIVAPTEIPTDIPPINLQETFDPKDYSGVGVEGGLSTGIVPTSDQVFLEAVVEEKPEVLSGPRPQYPEMLRQAGVQGRVIVQAVIDTTGRAIPSSLKIMQSPHAGFDQNAKSYVMQALFRPGRVSGRAVKVLVNVPIDFRLTK
jgi:protein TonB